MSETFKEYLIKQKKSPLDLLAQVGLVISALIIVFLLLRFGGDFIGPILIVGVVFGVGYLFAFFSKEYEYILTNNEMDIDVIYNRSRRKRLLTVDMKKIDIMASIEDKDHASDINKEGKLINASDNAKNKNTYAIIAPQETGLLKILITPNESFLNELYKQAPSKVIKY